MQASQGRVRRKERGREGKNVMTFRRCSEGVYIIQARSRKQ